MMNRLRSTRWQLYYVDAGQAVDNSTLSGIVGSAPPVTDGVTYERILNARAAALQNWLTYYTAPTTGSATARSTRSTRRPSSRSTPARVFQRGSAGLRMGKPLMYSFEASRSLSTASCSSRAGTVGSGPRRRTGAMLGIPDRVGVRRVAALRQREPRRHRGRRQVSSRPWPPTLSRSTPRPARRSGTGRWWGRG